MLNPPKPEPKVAPAAAAAVGAALPFFGKRAPAPVEEEEEEVRCLVRSIGGIDCWGVYGRTPHLWKRRRRR